jgi:tryptophan synthase alpha chain
MAPELCARIRLHSDIPIGVGLGVRNKKQASEIAGYADGVIVGSALVSAVAEGGDALAALTAELAAGVRSASAVHS